MTYKCNNLDKCHILLYTFTIRRRNNMKGIIQKLADLLKSTIPHLFIFTALIHGQPGLNKEKVPQYGSAPGDNFPAQAMTKRG